MSSWHVQRHLCFYLTFYWQYVNRYGPDEFQALFTQERFVPYGLSIKLCLLSFLFEQSFFTECTRCPDWGTNIANSLPEKNSHTLVQIYYSVLLLCFLIKLFLTFFQFPDPVNIEYFQLNQLIKYFHWVFSFSFTGKGNLFFPPWDQNKKMVKYATFFFMEQWFLHFLLLVSLLLKIKWQAIGKNARIYLFMGRLILGE